MNSTNFDITRLLPESSEGSSNTNQEPEVSPITVRQNIAAETTVNLRFSLKYNFVALLTSIAKVVATFTVILHVPHFCMGLKQTWLFAMTLYDLFYIRLIILTIKNIYEMNNLIRQHEPALNYNLQNRNSQNPSANANQGSEYNDEMFEDDEIREYDVEQYHRDLRISSLSPSVAENRRKIKRLTRAMDTIYFMIFAMGQLIYFLGSGGSCDTKNTDTLMLIYVFMGWIWILSPLILLVLGCLCLPFLLFCIYFFARGTRIPASKVDLKKLSVKAYSSEIQGSKECVICMLDYHDGDKIIQLECSPMHHFHETCLKRWLKINGQCPVCRTRIGQPGPHKHENHQPDETENNLI